MSEMDKVKKYLRKTLERLEAKVINSLPDEHYQKAILGADFLEMDELTKNSILDTPYTKGKHLNRAENAYIDNVSLLIKAQRSFDNGDIQKTFAILFNYHFQLGQIQQNITEEDGFKAIGTKRSKVATDKRYEKDKLIKLEACNLLLMHKPAKGWKDRTIAANTILSELDKFLAKTLLTLEQEAKNNPNSKPTLGSKLDSKNLPNMLLKWMKTPKTEVYIAFKETASLEWKQKFAKPKAS